MNELYLNNSFNHNFIDGKIYLRLNKLFLVLLLVITIDAATTKCSRFLRLIDNPDDISIVLFKRCSRVQVPKLSIFQSLLFDCSL